MSKRRTIAVIGGGSAGFTAARVAAKLGARVLFFMGERADRASLCVNTGCMPSKAMFHPIDAMHHARQHAPKVVGASETLEGPSPSPTLTFLTMRSTAMVGASLMLEPVARWT